MKVKVVLLIDVDPDQHNAEYGDNLSRSAIRDDVKQSVVNVVAQTTYPESSNIIRDVTLVNP